MAKKLDIQKVEAALKRAAKAGVSGSREARSGRFAGRDAMTGQFIEKARNTTGTTKREKA
jgi:hypothetical protein